jgi:alpha-beta hydrolase superfamily lysophospholipase
MSSWIPRSPRIVLTCRSLAALLGCALTACVTPRVQTGATDPQPPRLEPEVVIMEDGARLPLRTWVGAAQPRAAILAIHGLNDHSSAFEGTGAFLAARGFAVYAFDQRGFGRAPHVGIWAGGDRMAEDARQVALLLRHRHPTVPLYGLGESMGGAVLLHALQRHSPGWIDAAVLSAPAVWNRDEMRMYQRFPLRVLAHSWRGLRVSGGITGRRPTDDPSTLLYLREDPFVIRRTRVDMLWGVADLMDAVTGASATPGVPVLVLYGAHDQIVPAQAMCAWLETLPVADSWQPALYPSGWHLLTRDLDAARTLADLAAWFEQPGTSLPSGADTGLPVERVCALAGPTKRKPRTRRGFRCERSLLDVLTSCRPCRGRAARRRLPSPASAPRRSSPRSSARAPRRTPHSAERDA